MTASTLPRLARPRLLARAARAGTAFYRRERDLPGSISRATKGAALVRALVSAEAACDAERRLGAPSYNPARHVRLLTALLAEASGAVA